jgi:succinate dehydrogenase/fumarate reductase-like Fe-S protein
MKPAEILDRYFDNPPNAGGTGSSRKQPLPYAVRTYKATRELLRYLSEERLESIVFRRVGGEAICGGCGLMYKTHPNDEEYPFLTRACLGQLVKL